MIARLPHADRHGDLRHGNHVVPRRETGPGPEQHWVGVLMPGARRIGTHPSAAAAAEALARACGRSAEARKGPADAGRR